MNQQRSAIIHLTNGTPTVAIVTGAANISVVLAWIPKSRHRRYVHGPVIWSRAVIYGNPGPVDGKIRFLGEIDHFARRFPARPAVGGRGQKNRARRVRRRSEVDEGQVGSSGSMEYEGNIGGAVVAEFMWLKMYRAPALAAVKRGSGCNPDSAI